ncbi:NEDD4-binding protein 1-like isoform X2 [Spodoptera litura]|uniref:NEDD4-binding protein 1-like isoform X2 n=1 Tax=Spodoptera litura TaxID=69820 RepID=A0A9J7J2Q8_SPOLT|nr:NEDD4-binding protein 1-like isoform X2 [Spodoptera litura]
MTDITRCSECSLYSNKQRNKVAMSAYKMEQMRRQKQNHVQKNISKVFNKLKRDSIGSRSCLSPSDTTDESPQNLTIVVTNDSFLPERKRKSPITVNALSNLPMKTKRKSDSLIVINDDDLETNNDSCILLSPRRDSNSHVNCSTPIAKQDSQTLKNHIISNFYPVPALHEIPRPDETKEDDKTKIINKDSYVTIDLTADSENRTSDNPNVIDVDKCADKNDSQDCTLVSVSNESLSMSGDSDVTVIRNKKNANNTQAKTLARGLAQLNMSQKEKLLNIIAQQIFSGCDMKNGAQTGFTLQHKENRGTETDEDAYIKEVILGETKSKEAVLCVSRNSIGSNVYNPRNDPKNTTGLRMIVIDGSNVAMEHTQGRQFSVEGLKICIDYFVRRGHSVKAFVPRFRVKYGKSSDPNLLHYLERQGLVVFTPSREIKGRNCVPYDDRYILQCAAEFDGVVVSGDNYRDLINENKRWRYVIENRVLPFTWVNNMIMFPKDPFGRAGPTLEMLLRHPTPVTPQNTTSLFNSL